MNFKSLILKVLNIDCFPFNRLYYLYNNIPFNNRFCIHGIKLINHGALMHNCSFITTGTDNIIEIGKNSFLKNCRFVIYGNNNRISIDSGFFSRAAEFWIEDNGNHIRIGQNTCFGGKVHVASIEGCKVSIGNDCLFSSDIRIANGDSHSIIDEYGRRSNPAEDIRIGNHVWIGYKVIINKGSVISDNSVVGSGAVVNKKFLQSNIAIAGVPAKIVKENISWLYERI